MFERFTDRARRVVVLAQEEARLLNHNYIGTEHVLLGLLHEGEGVAAQVLGSEGIRLDAVRQAVDDLIGEGGATPSGHIPFTPRAKKVLELSLREALQLGHNYIGTEHILLGLIREGEGVAFQVLAAHGVELTRVRQKVVDLLAGIGPEAAGKLIPTGLLGEGMTRAWREAGERGHQRVGTEHVLLWLLSLSDSGAVRALEDAAVDLDTLRSRLDELLEEGNGSTDP